MFPALLADAWQPNWLLADKVDFNGTDRVIYVHPEVTLLDIRADVYTAWVDWVALYDNLKYLAAFRTTGMDPIGPGVYTGDVYFLINGWKLYVDLSRVRITGVLYSDNYPSAYFKEDGTQQYPVTVSALVNTVSIGEGVPTAAQNAQAVWERPTAANHGQGSFGEKVKALDTTPVPLSEPDKTDIAQKVWAQPKATQTDTGTMGGFLARQVLTIKTFLGLS